MLRDEITAEISSGNGGDGRIAFFPNRSGPSGGTGGDGGNVYIVADKRMSTLSRYKSHDKFKAVDGQEGGPNKQCGANGADLEIRVPLGTTCYNLDIHREFEMEQDGQRELVARGGRGGRGNESFKDATHQAPKKRELGTPAQKRQYRFVQKLIADYGLIGLPNAGKSSLLNMLAGTSVKTADYPFTTLGPSLGVVDGTVMADIPGLIEGASQGKGLGIKFLKHIEKVQLLLHCVRADSEEIIKDYKTIMNELQQYNEMLTRKPIMILLTAIDLVDEGQIKKQVALLKQFGHEILPVSIYDESTIARLRKKLTKDQELSEQRSDAT